MNGERILIRSTNWLGDSVITMPAVDSLRRAFPESRITVLARDNLASLWEMNPDVDEVLPFTPSRGFKEMGNRIRRARSLRERAFHTAILFPNSFGAALGPWLAGVPERVGYGGQWRRALLTRPVSRPADLEGKHQSYHYQHLIRTLHPSLPESPPPLPRIDIPEGMARWAEGLLAAYGIRKEEQFTLGLHPGAAFGPAKRWIPERFAASANRILEKRWGGVLLFGGGAEFSLCLRVAPLIRGSVVSLAGRTTLAELAALISRCDLLIANDTGTMHLAGAVGTPVVAVFGSTDPSVTGPLGPSRVVRVPVDCGPCSRRVCTADFRCMRRVTAEMVSRAAIELLEEGT